MRQHASDVLTDDGVRWEFKAPADLAIVKLDPEARRHLYLLLKEGVSNVARHAGARTASLRLDPAGGELRVELWDDGRGFVPKMVEGDWRRGGQGLRSMRERAARLGAHLAVESAPGRGTRLRLTIPLRMPRTTAIRPGGA